jgi:hypothetical protein
MPGSLNTTWVTLFYIWIIPEVFAPINPTFTFVSLCFHCLVSPGKGAPLGHRTGVPLGAGHSEKRCTAGAGDVRFLSVNLAIA